MTPAGNRAFHFASRHPWWSALLVLVAAGVVGAVPLVGAAVAPMVVIGGWAGVVYARARRRQIGSGASTPQVTAGPVRTGSVGHPVADPRWGAAPSEGVEEHRRVLASDLARAPGTTARNPDLADLARQLTWVTQLPLEDQIEVAGETHHVRGIRRVYSDANMAITNRGSTLEELVFVFVPEPWNPHDPHAVAVLIGGHQVGHLPAELAAEYAAPLHRRAGKGELVAGLARVWAKDDAGMVRARVTLLAPEVASI